LPVPPAPELPLIAEQRAERADAARNRQAILEAARRLMREQGPELITMDRLACEAGVGKGTLFRRFGDRASLFHALLDESERQLQEGFIRGPAPLGPGAPAYERLVAFGHALLAHTEQRGALMLAAEPQVPGMRYRSPVYAAYRSHVSELLAELEAGDHAYLTDVLLAGLSPELILHRLGGGMSLAALKQAWEDVVRRLIG
jgi:AcrR family transcriptional regulator